jgi:hypothetical protein
VSETRTDSERNVCLFLKEVAHDRKRVVQVKTGKTKMAKRGDTSLDAEGSGADALPSDVDQGNLTVLNVDPGTKQRLSDKSHLPLGNLLGMIEGAREALDRHNIPGSPGEIELKVRFSLITPQKVYLSGIAELRCSLVCHPSLPSQELWSVWIVY